jgi:hypothetical protein
VIEEIDANDGWNAGGRAPWVVCDAKVRPPVLACRRCQVTEEIEIPTTLVAFTTAANEFVVQHSRCKPRQATVAVVQEGML